MKENKIENKNFKVYMHTSPNGKRYIGITSQRPVHRWGGNGYGYIDNTYFWRAIQKYGWDNFQHEILFEGLTKEEAEQKEIELIAHYDSTNPSKGYNITAGGGYSFNVTLMPVKQYTMDGIFVKEYECIKDASEETGTNKGCISLCCNNKEKTANGYIWRFSDVELTQEHLSWCNTDEHSNCWIAVRQYSKNGEFIQEYKNVTLASLEVNAQIGSILSCCKGISKIAADSIWRYAWEELTEEHLAWCNEPNGSKHKRRIVQYLKDGTFIRTYESVGEAAKISGISRVSISAVCGGQKESVKGFIWRYASDITDHTAPSSLLSLPYWKQYREVKKWQEK